MGQKRNELQIYQDRAKVCELIMRGYRSRSEIASIINDGRDAESHISRSQVAADIDWMKNQYIERGFEDLAVYRHQAIDELTYLLKVYYNSFETSKNNQLTIEEEDIVDDETYEEMMYDAELGESTGGNKKVKTKKVFRAEGNVAFLNGAKSCLDAINKIRGVDGATKIALTDPTGTEEYTGIVEMMKFKMDELSEDKSVNDDSETKLLGASKIVEGEIIEDEELEDE